MGGLGPGIAGGILSGIGRGLITRQERQDRAKAEARKAMAQGAFEQLSVLAGMAKDVPELMPEVIKSYGEVTNNLYGYKPQPHKGKGPPPPSPGDLVQGTLSSLTQAFSKAGKGKGPPQPAQADLSGIGPLPGGMGRPQLPPVPGDLSLGELVQKRKADAQAAKDKSALDLYTAEKKVDAQYAKPSAPPHATKVPTKNEKGEDVTLFVDPITAQPIRDNSGKPVEYAQQAKSYNMTPQYVVDPDTKELLTVLQDPRVPTHRVFPGTGKPVPEDWKSVNPGAETAEKRALYWGQWGNYYKTALGKGLKGQEAMDAASDMVLKDRGVKIGRAEQVMALEYLQSGVGPGGSGISGLGSGGPKVAPMPGEASKPQASGSAPSAQPQDPDVAVFLSGILGNQRPGAKELPRYRKGQAKLAARLGVDETTLALRLAEDKSLVKAVGTTVQTEAAIDRLSNAIDAHGKNFLDAMKGLKETGSPLLDKPIREWDRKLFGSPQYKAYQLAKMEIEREYGRLAAGGSQSIAQIHEGTREHLAKLFNDGLTLNEAAALVEQLKIETKSAKKANRKTVQDLQGRIQGSLTPGTTISPVPGTPQADPLGILK